MCFTHFPRPGLFTSLCINTLTLLHIYFELFLVFLLCYCFCLIERAAFPIQTSSKLFFPCFIFSINLMRKLYSAKVARPIASYNTRPTRLGFGTTAWCPYEDLIAVISGCGAVAVFHADSPGEVSLLVGSKRSPARHVVWRNSSDKPLMLVVADAAGRITFWVSRDRRVNVWSVAADVDVLSVVIGIGWNKSSTTLAAILALGELAVFHVPDYPAHDRLLQRDKMRDPSANRPPDTKYANVIRQLSSTNQKLSELFGGHLRCATVAPGEVEPTSVALVTVSVALPNRLSVWNLSISKSSPVFDVRPIASTVMPPPDSGTCVACAAIPKSGMLFAIGNCGVIARWHLRQSRSNIESGWQLQAQTRVDRELHEAVNRGLVPKSNLPPPTDANSRSLEASRAKKVYSFEISSDCKSATTSTSAGLLFWDTEKLKIVAGHRVDHPLRPGLTLDTPSPYWGLCVSPTGASVFALNGRGYVDAFSLIAPIVTSSNQDECPGATAVARRLLSIPCADGLRGGWDLLSSIAFEGRTATTMVASALSSATLRSSANVPPERIAMVKSLMLRILNAEDASAAVAKQLLDLATDAIKKSAPENVKVKLLYSAKDAKSLTSPANVGKTVRQLLSTTRVVAQTQLAAAPLADWIMVLCAVWLQRCAEILSKHDPKGERMGKPWLSVVSMTVHNEKNLGPGHGIVYDTLLVRALRPAAFSALLLLALEDEFAEPETAPRYFRFSREEASCVVAALWEVSLAWESVDALTRTVKNGPAGPNPIHTGQTAEQMVTTAVVLGKHLAAGRAIENAKELRICPAEKALGLHGASKGAGFVMSCVRMHQGENGPVGLGDDATKSAVNLRAEWCQHDIVTGRSIPPWAPLRRCVVSGLLGAEITQQKYGTANVNMASPWSTKWAEVSPFGGRWARIPSLDLDRFDLLPAVIPAGGERVDPCLHNGVVMDRHVKTEEVLSPANTRQRVSIAPPHLTPQMQQPGGMPFPPDAHMNPAGLPPGAIDESVIPGSIPGSGIPPHGMMNSNGSQMSYPGAAAGGSPMLSHGLPGGMAARSQASPTLSSALSAEGGAPLSKGGKKRGAGSGGSRSRSKKRVAVEPRTPTGGQLSDLSNGMMMQGVGNGASPVAMNSMARSVSAADALSTETRSTVTAATNGTGGVDQEIGKTGSRKRKSKSRQTNRNAAAAAAAGSGVPPVGMSVGMASNVGPSFGQQGLHMPGPGGRNSMAKKQIHNNQRSPVVAATAAAAAAAAEAAAAAAAAPIGGPNGGAGRNVSMLPGGLHASGLGNVAGAGNVDVASPLPFVGGNLTGSGGMATQAGMGAVGPMGAGGMVPNGPRRPPGSLGLSADMNMMGGAMVGGNMGMNPGNMLPQGGNFGQMSGGLNMGGMNVQSGVNMNMLQQLNGNGNTNAGGAMAGMGGQGQQSSWAVLARDFGQLNELPPEHDVIDALHRKAELQAAASMGGGGAVTSTGLGNDAGMMTNGNVMGSGNIGGMDMAGNGMVGNMGAMVSAGMVSAGMVSAGVGASGMGQLNGSGGGINVGRNMVGGPGNGMMGMGVGMGNMRTSRAESVSSVPGRGGVMAGGLDTVGPNGVGLGINGDGGGMINDNNGGRVGSSSTQQNTGRSAPGPGRGLSENTGSGITGDDVPGERIWEGGLQAQGDENQLLISCVAVRYTFAGKAPITDSSTWPSVLKCDKAHLKIYSTVMEHVKSPTAQWYVRFTAIDDHGNEREDGGFVQFVSVLKQQYAFEIRCNEGDGNPGTLYLWGMQKSFSHSLYGAYKPDVVPPPQAPPPNDAELQYMMMNAGGGATGK